MISYGTLEMAKELKVLTTDYVHLPHHLSWGFLIEALYSLRKVEPSLEN